MRILRDTPIRRKLRIVILATCSVALLCASLALFALQFYFFRRDYREDLHAVAVVIANTSTGAISFNRPNAARDVLGVLRSRPRVLSAEIVLNNGRVFAAIGETRGTADLHGNADVGFVQRDGKLAYVQPIVEKGVRLGTLYIHTDYAGEAMQLFGVQAAILVGILALSFVVAIFVSSRLMGVITEPIRALAETARAVADRHDYSLRASKSGDDEVGEFADTFNEMLAEIERREDALRREIAERARAEREVRKIHEQLMQASRQAGMAEVATGVLHNVGNVLNSVNVSATLIGERLDSSRMANLVRAAHLLHEKNGAVGEFLTHDPKGRLLPQYLLELSGELARQREQAEHELDLLTRNIEHIKDIVATQQSYGRVSDFIEPLSVAGLVEDALRLNSGTFERDGITIERDYDDVPLALVDKHRVLQILVNVLRNAREAMEPASLEEKRLTVAVRQKDAQTLELVICDTGVGIAPENLTRVFSHGFTTREEGHGFGLHSAALTAQQLGGRLYAESKGEGMGASFILELPIGREFEEDESLRYFE
jgi:C4-dicarboxylate-specific signal transduction histidine kinase